MLDCLSGQRYDKGGAWTIVPASCGAAGGARDPDKGRDGGTEERLAVIFSLRVSIAVFVP